MEIDISLWGAVRIPGLPQSSSMLSREWEPPFLFRTEDNPTFNDLFVFRLGMDQGVPFGTFGPSGRLTYM